MNTILSELPMSLATKLNRAIVKLSPLELEKAADAYIQTCKNNEPWRPRQRWTDGNAELFSSMGLERLHSELDFPCPSGVVFMRQMPEVCFSMSFLLNRLRVEYSIWKTLNDGMNDVDLARALGQILAAEMVIFPLMELHSQQTGTQRLLSGGGSDCIKICFPADGCAYAILEI
jgi:hypothetical protein